MFATTLNTTINLLPILISSITSFGILLHDTQVDHATAVANDISIHASAHDGNGTSNPFDNPAIRLNDQTAHTHNEVARYNESVRHLGNVEPRLNTRDTDIKKFMEKKIAIASTA